jgi:glycosyltransferase involved in cell wall biosynthesis
MTTAVAVLTVRNESVHIWRCLRDFIAEGAEVILVDHDSTDDTVAKAREFLGRGLLAIERLPWTGVYSLAESLGAQRSIIRSVRHDWVIHADADEWLSAPQEDVRLIDGIAAADRSGFNCINFNEFVFIPADGRSHHHEGYRSELLSYYFFRPVPTPRLMRAWKRESGLDNCKGAGHTLSGRNVRLCDETFILRHYIALSSDHARAKYLGRPYSQDAVAKGWHWNRINLTAEALEIRLCDRMQRLPHEMSKAFRTDLPVEQHYWQW